MGCAPSVEKPGAHPAVNSVVPATNPQEERNSATGSEAKVIPRESSLHFKSRIDEFDEASAVEMPLPFTFPRPARFMHLGPKGITGEVRPIFFNGVLFSVYRQSMTTIDAGHTAGATAPATSPAAVPCRTWALYNDTTDKECRVTIEVTNLHRLPASVRVPHMHKKTAAVDPLLPHCTAVDAANGTLNIEIVVAPFTTVVALELLDESVAQVNIVCDEGHVVPVTAAVSSQSIHHYENRLTAHEQRCAARSESDVCAMRRFAEQHLPQLTQITANTSMEALLRLCVDKNRPFVDLSFPPDDRAIDPRTKAEAAKDGTPCLDKFPWARPQQLILDMQGSQYSLDQVELMCKQVRLFRHGCDPCDIQQGFLGDCWFLSAVAVLATRPEKVKRLFRHPTSTEAGRRERRVGAYRVSINISGWWTRLIVDDYFPASIGHFAFAHHVQDPCEIWTCVLEKAYAKAHGFYGQLTTGDSLLALQDLTGFPSVRFTDEWTAVRSAPAQVAELSKKLLHRLYHLHVVGALITINTEGTDTAAYMGSDAAAKTDSQQKMQQDLFNEAGLPMGHAFAVVEMLVDFGKSVPHPPSTMAANGEGEGHPFALVKVFNPWGNGFEWTGRWSDEDNENWNQYPALKALCKPTNKGDGMFWMQWSDVLRFFEGGGAALVKSNWHDYRIQTALSNPSIRKKSDGEATVFALHIRVKQPVSAFITLSQHNERIRTANRHEDARLTDGEYEAVALSIGRVESGSEFLNDVTESATEVAIAVQRTAKTFRSLFGGGSGKGARSGGDADVTLDTGSFIGSSSTASSHGGRMPQPKTSSLSTDKSWRCVPDAYASLEVDAPSRVLSYNMTRDLSIQFNFQPLVTAESSSFLVVPSLYDGGDDTAGGNDVPVRFGIVADTPVDGELFAVELVELPRSLFTRSGFDAHVCVMEAKVDDSEKTSFPLRTCHCQYVNEANFIFENMCGSLAFN